VIERMINVNLYGMIHVTKTFLPLLLNRPEAHITNVSSMGGLFAVPGQTFYGASKAAVKLIAEGLYAELRETNVGVTVVYPGAVDTNITKNNDAHLAALDQASKHFRGTSPRVAAALIIRSMENKRFKLVIGLDAKIMIMLYWISPTFALKLVSRVMKRVLRT
jgi:short-subunit dehydrogenase